MTLLVVAGLTASAAGRTVLAGVDLTVAAGDCVALVGASGSGKSLTARALLALPPHGVRYGGEVRLDGRDLLAASERELRRVRGASVGVVFQEPATALDPLMPIGAQIAEPLALHGYPSSGRRERVRALLARVGLPDVPPSRRPRELSGGQRQRVAVAIALAASPRLVVADEATSALDAVSARAVLELLLALTRDAGTALLLVTHDLGIAAAADRIAVMDGGRIVEDGPAAAVLRAPQSATARALVRPAPPLPPRPAPAGPAVLAAEGITVRRDGRTLVADARLAVRAGERLALVGGSGAGKTTLVRAILGLLPREGTVRIDGVALERPDALILRRAAGMVFQDPATSLDPRMSALDAVAEALHRTTLAPAERRRRAAEALARVGIASGIERPPHAFSGGQRQRIAIARALVARPRILFADEAVSALDAALRVEIVALIDTLVHAEGMALVFVAHDLALVRALADRVAVMAGGQIVEEGETAAVFARPRHAATAALVAAAPAVPRDDAVGAH